MYWIEDSVVDAGDRRVLLATAGPYLLSVIEHDDGSAHWSCGVGEDDVVDEREGKSHNADLAMRAAVKDARRRWLETDGLLGELETDMRQTPPKGGGGDDYDLASQISSDRTGIGPKRAAGRLRRTEPPPHRRAG